MSKSREESVIALDELADLDAGDGLFLCGEALGQLIFLQGADQGLPITEEGNRSSYLLQWELIRCTVLDVDGVLFQCLIKLYLIETFSINSEYNVVFAVVGGDVDKGTLSPLVPRMVFSLSHICICSIECLFYSL